MSPPPVCLLCSQPLAAGQHVAVGRIGAACHPCLVAVATSPTPRVAGECTFTADAPKKRVTVRHRGGEVCHVATSLFVPREVT